MDHSASRANFLHGRFGKTDRPVRPPWALDEAAFAALCDGCGRCAKACPEGIIVRGRGGLPQIDFTRGGCTFCGECLQVCEPGALADRGQAAWRNKASITSRCFSWQGVVCRLCEEQCEQRAIRFRPALGGYSLPEVDAEACDGCGACVTACPSGAVEVGEPKT